LFISNRTEVSGLSASGVRTQNHIIDFSEFETDFTSPFHRTSTHKNRWLMTTGVAGLVGALVVGGALLGTFGLGNVQRPSLTAQVIETAEILQDTSGDVRRDRLLGVLGMARIVGRREFADVIAETPQKRLATTLEQTEEPQAVPRRSLLQSISPGSRTSDQQVADAPARAERPLTKPKVLASEPPAADDPLRTAALTPASIGNSTIPVPDTTTAQIETVTVARGQTLMGILTDRGANRDEARRLIAALEPVFPTRLLKDGQEIDLSFVASRDDLGNEIIRPTRLEFNAGDTRHVVVELDKSGDFIGSHSGTQVASLPAGDISQTRTRGRIAGNFYSSAVDQGVPKPIIAEMMRVHSFDVDFQREIRDGDTFEVFYGQPISEKDRGRNVVLYSAITTSGETKGYYRFTTLDDGITDYYDETGRSATTFLMRTPVSGARISSSFGMRKHPILGYTRLHSGVDFAAGYGTPIKAAGNGVIDKAGRFGSYGKYVRIRHANGFGTAYAHMSRFASGIKAGKRIRQGQVIGYVGSTGRSTGPHLHYEVMVKGKQVNPMTVRMPTGRRLADKMLAAFNREKATIDAMMQGAPSSTRVAAKQ
jgi:murein DD-endopeptidase MepM/ murein hydrolase activator NlpD